MASERAALGEMEGAIERARRRAAKTGELKATVTGSFAPKVSPEVASFVREILTDAAYTAAVDEIGPEDPDLASS